LYLNTFGAGEEESVRLQAAVHASLDAVEARGEAGQQGGAFSTNTKWSSG
jgi:hypothetical protein